MSDLVSGLYDGVVVHRRMAPRAHRLRYRIFQLLLDLDELPALDRGLRLFAHNRFALFSLHERDHLAGDGQPLRAQIETMLADAGIDIAGGPIRLLCMPRVLGYVFDPLTLFYCHRPDDALAAVVLEVNNTFGEKHCYVVEADGEGVARRACAKAFFVSPFMDMEMTYDFRLPAPGEEAITAIQGRGPDGAPIITAAFSGQRRVLTDRNLVAAFVSHPLLTLKVILAIHWEAAKLVAKGVKLRRKPAPPAEAATVFRLESQPPAAQEAQAHRRAGDVAFVGRRGGLKAEQAEGPDALVGEEAEVEFAA